MKKIFTGALALLLFMGAAQAQTEKTDKQEHKEKHGWMKQLHLTADQKSQLKALHQQQHQEMQALKANTSMTAAQQKAQRQELHKKFQDQAQAIFTPEQKQQIEKMKSEWKAKHKDGKDKETGAFRKGKFATEMNLTQEQKDRIRQVMNESKTGFEAVRNDKTLTEEQKRSRIEELRKARHEQVKSVLTKEQLEKMESLRKTREAKNSK